MKRIIFSIIATVILLGILSSPGDSFLDCCRKANERVKKEIYIGLVYRLNRPDVQYYEIFYKAYSDRYCVKILTIDWEFLAYEDVKLNYFKRILTDLNYL